MKVDSGLGTQGRRTMLPLKPLPLGTSNTHLGACFDKLASTKLKKKCLTDKVRGRIRVMCG